MILLQQLGHRDMGKQLSLVLLSGVSEEDDPAAAAGA
jgi:hypothetical protein